MQKDVKGLEFCKTLNEKQLRSTSELESDVLAPLNELFRETYGEAPYELFDPKKKFLLVRCVHRRCREAKGVRFELSKVRRQLNHMLYRVKSPPLLSHDLNAHQETKSTGKCS